MNMPDKVWIRETLERSEKMRPLTLALVQAAIEQGASIREFTDACQVATASFRDFEDNLPLSHFGGDGETAFNGVRERLDALFG